MYRIKQNLFNYSLYLSAILLAVSSPAFLSAERGGGGGMHGGFGGGGVGVHGNFGGGVRWDGDRGNDYRYNRNDYNRYDNDRFYRDGSIYNFPLYNDGFSSPSYYNNSNCYYDDEGNYICGNSGDDSFD